MADDDVYQELPETPSQPQWEPPATAGDDDLPDKLRVHSLARAHYAEHEDKPFFGSLLEFITSGPVVAAVLEGPRAVAAFRQLAGGTDPVEKATPGTIRGDFWLETQFNLVHGSDSTESAEREIALWFPDA